MFSVEEARKAILERVSPLETEKVPLIEALGRVIAEDIFAGHALPPWDHSAMDGYALRAEDTLGASPGSPVRLDVVEEIPAGTIPRRRIGPGQAARIMTGAPIPEGADAVTILEDTRREEARIYLSIAATAGRHIRPAGTDVQAGEQVISRGDLIRPAGVGMLVSLGRPSVFVHRRPRVAIVATGDELVDIDAPAPPGKIFASNGYDLAARVQECGAIPLQTGIARDTREDLAARFREAAGADLIISSGGVSGGDYDFVKEIMHEAGNCLQFWQVAMKPGRPFAFGALGGIPLFGLPGNPVATMVCFEQFVRPAILRMLGHTNPLRRTLRARIEDEIRKDKGVRVFIQARILYGGDGYSAAPAGKRGSGMLKEMVRANGLIVLPEETTLVRAGDLVDVHILTDSPDRAPGPE